MRKEGVLRERRCPRRGLKIEDRTDLRFEDFQFYEGDLFNGSELDRRAFDRVGCDAEP